MGESVLITSGKGGVGKTTVTAYLGRALAERGCHVCVLDADLNMSNLDVAMRQEERVVHGIEEVLNGQCRLRSALLPDPTHPNLMGLYVKSPARFSENAFQALCEELKRAFDWLLLDCPAGIDGGFRRAANIADNALIVTTPHVSAVRDADRVAQALAVIGRPIEGVVINRVSGKKIARGEMMSPYAIAEVMRLNLIGVIPEEDGLAQGDRWSESARLAFKLTAKRLAGGSGEIYDPVKRERNPFYLGNLRRLTDE